MTRKQLAADSHFFERCLADVESGKGNVSINSLYSAGRSVKQSLKELARTVPGAIPTLDNAS